MRISVAALTLLVSASSEPRREPVDQDFFEKKVRPILAANCVNCHGPNKQKGGLRLDTRAEFRKGGDNGAAVMPGKPEASRLVKATSATTMT